MPPINPDSLPPNSPLKRAIEASMAKENAVKTAAWNKSKRAASRSIDELKPSETPTKPRKYRNKPVTVGDEHFRSELEYTAWLFLCNYFVNSNVIREVSIPLGPIEGTNKNGKKSNRQRRMQPDFMVINAGKTGVLFFDAKGFKTKDWAVKADWLKQKHGITVHILDKSNINVTKLPGGGYAVGQPSDELLKEIFGE